MGQNQRRPGFLRWGEGARPESGEPTTVVDADEAATAVAGEHEAETGETAQVSAAEQAPKPALESEPVADTASETPFLRDLVGALREARIPLRSVVG